MPVPAGVPAIPLPERLLVVRAGGGSTITLCRQLLTGRGRLTEELIAVHLVFLAEGSAGGVQEGWVGVHQVSLERGNSGLVYLELHCRGVEVHGHCRKGLQSRMLLKGHRRGVQGDVDLLLGGGRPDQLRRRSGWAKARGTSRWGEWGVVLLLGQVLSGAHLELPPPVHKILSLRGRLCGGGDEVLEGFLPRV